MKRLIIAAALLAGLIGIYVQLGWYVVIKDETGLAVKANISNPVVTQTLTKLPFGYFVGIPEVEGHFEVICSDGTTVSGRYVTPNYRYRLNVVGKGTCANLI